MDIASISGLAAAIGVLIGVVLAILELRNITKTNGANHEYIFAFIN